MRQGHLAPAVSGAVVDKHHMALVEEHREAIDDKYLEALDNGPLEYALNAEIVYKHLEALVRKHHSMHLMMRLAKKHLEGLNNALNESILNP